MGCLVILLGLLVCFWGMATIVTLVEGVVAAKILASIIEIALVTIFVICLKEYRKPENREKRIQAQKNADKKRAEEKQRWIEEQNKRKEAERLRTTVVATRLIGEGSAEYKKSVGGMIARGAVGGIIGGTAGAALGMATAKNKNTNKDVRRFLVKYLDGHIEEKEATIGSARYKEYMAHLEWDNK